MATPKTACPVCKSKNLEFIAKITGGPAMQNKLSSTFAEAKKEKPTGINLWGARNCGFIFNADFDPALVDYSAEYNNTPDFSSYFHNYVTEIATRLFNKYKLKNKVVLEIGCGKGNFLEVLYSLGCRKLIGFDPAYELTGSPLDKMVERKLFNKKNFKGNADFIICRETLEHIPQPQPFIKGAIDALRNGGGMYFEVPNLEWIIKKGAFFDFTYEHCNYFSKYSIFTLFNQLGPWNISFGEGAGGQYIQAEITRRKPGSPPPPLHPYDFEKVSKFVHRKTREYKNMVKSWRKFAIWGVAGKGVTFLNRLGISHRVSPYAIDINPQKHGRFVPITGQRVVGPSILKKEKIGTIIIMNPIYEKEVKRDARYCGYKGKFFIPYARW
ncbi:methyltransferase domain-containing protein [Candidatus Giovannonibacteria bacterium]|nr:methyltransferase domain-containing protein [Candidatus Giovannonibacteria bacterium]